MHTREQKAFELYTADQEAQALLHTAVAAHHFGHAKQREALAFLLNALAVAVPVATVVLTILAFW
jgi:Zn-dependent membrane protease YugP